MSCRDRNRSITRTIIRIRTMIIIRGVMRDGVCVRIISHMFSRHTIRIAIIAVSQRRNQLRARIRIRARGRVRVVAISRIRIRNRMRIRRLIGLFFMISVHNNNVSSFVFVVVVSTVLLRVCEAVLHTPLLVIVVEPLSVVVRVFVFVFGLVFVSVLVLPVT